jgi:pimeloyl-ACP methyl ester carboxylesterase
MRTVISKDGTAIAYQCCGNGPALIVVDGALCSRTFGPSAKLAAALSEAFSVYTYDRRGRGQSTDTLPYSPAREVEDLQALIEAAGGSAAVLGLSSGAALALEAAAAGSSITRMLAYEPPYVHDTGDGGADHQAQLQEHLAAGRRGAAVAYFMNDMVGAPRAIVIVMRLMPWIWRKLEAVAPTLPYDAAVMSGFRIPRARLASIGLPALVMNGSKTDARLKAAARAVAATIPLARHRELAGQTHNVNARVLATAAVEFLAVSGSAMPVER